MNEKYKTELMWTLPLNGTFGKKAENLYNNTPVILDCGWNIPRSIVIPYEYYQMEGGNYYMLDDISEHFKDCEFVAIRSSSPDEDLGGRTPGLYHSEKVRHKDRNKAMSQLESVLRSYYNPQAFFRREKEGLPTRGMSLLVQEWLPTKFCGSFSDIGETAVLLFADATNGIEAMLKPSRRKLFVNSKGEIDMNSHYITTYDQQWAKGLRRITNQLPSLGEKGWELEFSVTDEKEYILQTTPIKKQPRFEVISTDNNIFDSREVIGTGTFKTNGILYLPYGGNFDMNNFDKKNKDYCLVVSGGCISKAPNNEFNPLTNASNARALIYVNPLGYFSGLGSFAAHTEAYIRDLEGCGLVGKFTNKFKKIMSGKERDTKPLFLKTNLLIQTDEIEQKANMEIV
jgi:hypothetical protein